MTFALNTGHALYGNLKMLLGVNESNVLVDLVTPTRTFTKHASAVYGTGGFGRHAGIRHASGAPYGWAFDTAFQPANNTGTLLIVLNGVTAADYGGYCEVIGNNDPSWTTRLLPRLLYGPTGGMRGACSNPGNGNMEYGPETTTQFIISTPQMFTLTRDGQTANAIYANGTSEGTGTQLGLNSTSGVFNFLGGISTQAGMDADVVYVAWFDKSLSPTEVSDLYASLGASNTFGLLASTDTTAPTLTSPTGTATGATTAGGTVSTNEATGTLYYLASINATETAATVKAASSQAVTATGTQSVSFTGLSSSTTYYAHYCHRDAAGNDSTVANSATFTTSAATSTDMPILNPQPASFGTHFFGLRR